MKYRLAHKVKVPRPYVPELWSDVSKTIKADRKRLAEEEAAKPFKAVQLRRVAS